MEQKLVIRFNGVPGSLAPCFHLDVRKQSWYVDPVHIAHHNVNTLGLKWTPSAYKTIAGVTRRQFFWLDSYLFHTNPHWSIDRLDARRYRSSARWNLWKKLFVHYCSQINLWNRRHVLIIPTWRQRGHATMQWDCLACSSSWWRNRICDLVEKRMHIFLATERQIEAHADRLKYLSIQGTEECTESVPYVYVFLPPAALNQSTCTNYEHFRIPPNYGLS
jgi:hypothetical protein